jgi:hypothetical protein
MKFNIFYGNSKPLTAVGKYQVNMLQFAEKYRGWHSYASDKTTLRALNGLIKRGSIVINNNQQFKINI